MIASWPHWAKLAGLGLVALTSLACQQPGGAEARPVPEPPAWALANVDHWLPGPHRRAQAQARAWESEARRRELDDGCRGCHVDIAKQWRGSQHASAWSSDAFQAAFAVEPLPFCQGCHAPEVDPEAEVPEWPASVGVGCVTCHVEPGTELVWAAGDPDVRRPAPHPVRRAPAFAGPQACARCHEFEFPDAALRERPLAMQATIREHAASAQPERSCADCHMPSTAAGQRSHEFIGAYDRAMLARSLVITASRELDRVTLELAPGDVAHAVPTGDLLRRLEVRLELASETQTAGQAGQLLARRWLGRRFGAVRQQNGLTLRAELEDTRVGPHGARVVLQIPDHARTHTLRWAVVHQRVAHAVGDPARAPIEGQIEFASGLLQP